ncbi:2OG-Fe(II) oxygenase family protein [Thalassobaculum fulvum]|nr:2OG-Fe(II) oxygenase family protein [Thalassobaculum fulvum]
MAMVLVLDLVERAEPMSTSQQSVPDVCEPVLEWGFAVPMMRWRLPEADALNNDLRAVILAREARGDEARVSNVGGWQSRADFLDGTQPCVVALRGHLISLIRSVMASPVGGDLSRIEGQIGLTGWANVNRDGDFNRVHDHAGSHWSGVYYVDTGRPDPGSELNGAIEFLDPRPSINMPIPGYRTASALAVTPSPGEFVLFPSWLQHYVLPFRGSGERISVAFNAQVKDYRLK